MARTTLTETAILVIDDEVSLRNTFSIFLRRAGYETVLAVGSYDEAIEAVSLRNFDLIICDIVLESHSGIDLLKRFRQLRVFCPVVIITGYPHVETASEAVRLGAFDYLSKPVEKEALLKTARLAIQQYRLELEKREAELAGERYRRILETIFKSVTDSIISVDKDLNILKMNQAATALFGTLQSGLEEGGNLAALCLNKDLCRLTENVTDVMKTGLELSDHRRECFPDGVCKVLSICISPLDDGTGEPAGAVLVFRDMSHNVQSQRPGRTQFHKMIGASPVMQNVYMMVENIARVDTTLLITGESGTGKELVVHALHQESLRRNRPLIMVDCASMPENLLESELFGHRKGSFTGAEENRMGRILQADGGTLFLDEIGNVSMNMQLRLLRFLQEKTFYPVGSDKEIRVDVRVVAATNADLKEKVTNGGFREDLYFRLLIIDIRMPPLRVREGDIELLANHFIDHFARRMEKSITGISEQAMGLLLRYQWPGNVRQLEHVIERACILCTGSTISCEHLPEEVSQVSQGDLRGLAEAPLKIEESRVMAGGHPELSDQERQTTMIILAALQKAGGNKAKAARILNIDRSTLYRKMHELHMDIDMFS
ncbi:MAG: sigma-54-dependent Fis family transcriptional regulator [Desulfoprunum sp.]|nr:sigma-54-dependent Fis family transcriptional regulator [Desulfoprunum sp.]